MPKLKINDNSSSDDAASSAKVVSPTQSQMDEWVEEELQEAKDDNMLGDDTGKVFPEDSKSID